MQSRGEERSRRRDETGSPARGKVRGLTVGGLGPVLSCPVFYPLSFFRPLHFAHSLLPERRSCPRNAESYFFRQSCPSCISRSVGGQLLQSLRNGVSMNTVRPRHPPFCRASTNTTTTASPRGAVDRMKKARSKPRIFDDVFYFTDTNGHRRAPRPRVRVTENLQRANIPFVRIVQFFFLSFTTHPTHSKRSY